METSVDYDQPDLIPAAERAISLVGRMVYAAVPDGLPPVVGPVVDWGYDSGGVVVWVDGVRGPEEVWQHDAKLT